MSHEAIYTWIYALPKGRAGVLTLLDGGDFTATIDIEDAAPHQVFELVVDWERFAATRIRLRLAIGGNDEPDEGVAS